MQGRRWAPRSEPVQHRIKNCENLRPAQARAARTDIQRPRLKTVKYVEPLEKDEKGVKRKMLWGEKRFARALGKCSVWKLCWARGPLPGMDPHQARKNRTHRTSLTPLSFCFHLSASFFSWRWITRGYDTCLPFRKFTVPDQCRK